VVVEELIKKGRELVKSLKGRKEVYERQGVSGAVEYESQGVSGEVEYERSGS
jgi:hypothetical protein